MPWFRIDTETEGEKIEQGLKDLKALSKFPEHFVIAPLDPKKYYEIHIHPDDLPSAQSFLDLFNAIRSTKPQTKEGESAS